MKNSKGLIALLVSASLIGTTMLPTGVAYASGKHISQHSNAHGYGKHYGHGRHYDNYRHGRPYSYYRGGHSSYHHNNDVWVWLGFAALTLAVVSSLNAQQKQIHEHAQARATTAPIGETIIWHEGNASGSVTPTRDGTTPSGRYCREFQHQVTVGGKSEQAYGTACQQPDGSWQILSDGTP